MRPQLSAVAAGNRGLFRRRNALDCGYTARELKTLTRPGGKWVIVRRGCYVERSVWEPLSLDERYVLEARAAYLSLCTEAVLSHTSAAALLGMPLRPRWRELVHVTRPGVRGGRTEHGVKHHLAGFDGSELVTVDGIDVTSSARTVLDIGREFGFEDAVISCDAALRSGTAHEELGQAIARMRNWPSITPVRAAVAIADGGAANMGESMARVLVMELGIGTPETQFHVRDSGWLAIADLRVGRHLFEFDGRVKYVGRARGGVADRPVEEVVWAEKRREDRLRSLGWGVSRLVWDDLLGPARRRARHRLLTEFSATARRYGDAA